MGPKIIANGARQNRMPYHSPPQLLRGTAIASIPAGAVTARNFNTGAELVEAPADSNWTAFWTRAYRPLSPAMSMV